MITRLFRRRPNGDVCLLLLAAVSLPGSAQPWVSYADNTRYMALGDSVSAGYEAKPVTHGFAFQLYQSGAIDNINNLLFCAAAVPGATSIDVLKYQVPQVHLFFEDTGTAYRKVITLTVGGNDMLTLLRPDGTVDSNGVPAVLQSLGNNMFAILNALTSNAAGDVRVYVGNQYDPKLPIVGEEVLVGALNQVTAQIVGLFPGKAVIVDVYSAFLGRSGLLLIEKKGAGFNVHPTNAGYGVIAAAFADAIRGH